MHEVSCGICGRFVFAFIFSLALHLSLVLCLSLAPKNGIEPIASSGTFQLSMQSVRLNPSAQSAETKTHLKHTFRAERFDKGESATETAKPAQVEKGSSETKSAESMGIEVEYPRSSRWRREQGEVVFQLRKKGEGFSEPEMLRSSGFGLLDEAAKNALHRALENRSSQLSFRDGEKVSFHFRIVEI